MSLVGGKRRKLLEPTPPPSIDRLPDVVLGCVGDYLPKTARALLDAAISPPTKVGRSGWLGNDWETLDFDDLDRDVAARLTDDDLASVLRCTEARTTLKCLKLTGCVSIVGHGLSVLRGMVALRQIDLSLVGLNESPVVLPEPAISHAVVIPILTAIVEAFGNQLAQIQFPRKWRLLPVHTSPILMRFYGKYSKLLNSRFIGCSKCDEDWCGAGEYKAWIASGGDHRGLQKNTCYYCVNRFCNDCTTVARIPCSVCEKIFCDACYETRQCGDCDRAECGACTEMDQCDDCDKCFCDEGNCTPINYCTICEMTRCDACMPHNVCDREGCSKSCCADCGDVDTVQWCECCSRDMCTDCRLEVYRENRAGFCEGCKSLVFDRIIIEHESMRQRLDELDRFQEIDPVDDDLIVDLERLEQEMLESDPESDLDI